MIHSTFRMTASAMLIKSLTQPSQTGRMYVPYVPPFTSDDQVFQTIAPRQVLINPTGAGGLPPPDAIDLTEYDTDITLMESDGYDSSSSHSIPPTPTMPIAELRWSPLDHNEDELYIVKESFQVDTAPSTSSPSPVYSPVDLPAIPFSVGAPSPTQPTLSSPASFRGRTLPSPPPSRKRKAADARSYAESEYYASDDGSDEDDDDEYVERRPIKRVKKSPIVPCAPPKRTKKKKSTTKEKANGVNEGNTRLLELFGNGDSDECIFCDMFPGRGQDLVRHLQGVHYKDGNHKADKKKTVKHKLKDGWTAASLTDYLRPIITGDPVLLEKEEGRSCRFCHLKLSRKDARDRHMRNLHNYIE
jgi:hypothetical protein